MICPSCGQENSEGFRFCGACAGPLTVVAPAGVRKTVTVLFCDVTGWTALGESIDPEALRGLLARYFERMKGIVELHGGTVEKFIGDAVMAVFGVPAAHEDDALRACRAAVETLTDRCRRAELVTDLALGPREKRHRRRRDGCESNPDPACSRFVSANQVADRLDRDVRGENELAQRDQLLRVPLGSRRSKPRSGEAPDDGQPGRDLDQAVHAECDERDGTGRDSGAERDRELDQVPRISAPREQSSPPLKPGPVGNEGDRAHRFSVSRS